MAGCNCVYGVGRFYLIALYVALSDWETCASKQLAPPLPYTQLQTALGYGFATTNWRVSNSRR
jgi:hypothetical protein